MLITERTSAKLQKAKQTKLETVVKETIRTTGLIFKAGKRVAKSIPYLFIFHFLRFNKSRFTGNVRKHHIS